MDEEEYARWVGVQVKDASLATGGDVTPPAPPFGGGPPPAEQPAQGPPPEPSRNGQGAAATGTGRILGAAELAVTHARERAGARLWSRAVKCDDCRDLVRNVPKSMVACTLGPTGLPEPQPPPGALVEGATEPFLQQLLRWGLNLETASYLAGAVHRHAAQTLYLPDPVGVPPELIGYAEHV